VKTGDGSGPVVQLTDPVPHGARIDVWQIVGACEGRTVQELNALCVAPPQAGTHSVLDAVPLDDQRYLLALGESGACVVDVRGRILARFATPAQRLVLAHSKQVALLLAKRKDVWRVGRLDLVQHTTTDLGVLAFDFWGTQFDGLHWTIAEGRRIRVLDTQESLRRVVWQVPDLPGQVQALTASRALEQIIVAGGEGPAELWTYRLPQRQLAARTDLVPPVDMVRLLNPQGGILDIQVEETDGLLGLEQFSLDRFADDGVAESAIAALLPRARVTVRDDLTAAYPARWPTNVVVTLRDGAVECGVNDFPRGNPENPVSTETLEDKFVRLVAPRYNEAFALRALDTVRSLGECADVAATFHALG